MATMGRPRVLDEAKQREVCALVSAGAGIATAAKYVGCSRSTVYREAKQNEEFRVRLDRAKATACLSPLQAMRQACQHDWRAAAWMLERTDPERFGRPTRNTFGRRELSALTRDLLAIVRDEVDHPLQRDGVIERMRATLNYAMRHAWDPCRSGASLARAMRSFEKRNPTRVDWPEFSFARDFSESEQQTAPIRDQTFATPDDSGFRKGEVFTRLLDQVSARVQALAEEDSA